MIRTVVVDGGGSGCRLGAYDEHGTLCATANEGPASLTLDVNQSWQNIQNGVKSLGRELGQTSDWLPEKLSLGLAGSLQQSRREQFLALIPQSINCSLVTDGQAQLAGASNGEPAICLSVGTGSVLHWLDENGVSGMAGGWGFPVGDEGSGAWLGVRLLNQYLWYRDGKSQGAISSPLFSALEQKIGNSVSDIQLWTTCRQSTQMATLAPLVVDAASRDDPLAVQLLDEGAALCMKLLSTAPQHLPVFVVGGLAEIYHTLLQPQLGERLHVARGNALSGLYLISHTHE